MWGPFTRLVWLVFIIGVPAAIFGWLPVLIFAAASLAVVIPLALLARSREREAPREDKLDAIMATWKEVSDDRDGRMALRRPPGRPADRAAHPRRR